MRWSWVGMVVLALAACERDRAQRNDAPETPAPEASRPAVPEQPQDLSRMPPEPAEAGTAARPCPEGTERREIDDGTQRDVSCVDDDGRLHGPRSHTVPGVPWRFHSEYVQGELHGWVWEWFDGDGVAVIHVYDRGKLVVQHGYFIGRRIDTKYYDGAGELVRHLTWHLNGRRASEMFVRDGDLHGPAATWYENGQKASEGRFADGDKVGDWRYWDPEGKPITEDEQTAFAIAQ